MFSENNYFPLSGNGGIVGLTEDEDKFRRWQICSPEVARVVFRIRRHYRAERK